MIAMSLFGLIGVLTPTSLFMYYLHRWRKVNLATTATTATGDSSGVLIAESSNNSHRQSRQRMKRKACGSRVPCISISHPREWDLCDVSDQTTTLQVPFSQVEETGTMNSGWATCHSDILYKILESVSWGVTAQNMRLVNHHWCGAVSRSVKEVALHPNSFYSVQLKSFKLRFNGLRKLTLRDPEFISDSWLQELTTNAPQLIELNIRFVSSWAKQYVGEDGLRALLKMSNLVHLELSGCKFVGVSGMCILSNKQNLKHLDLSYSDIGDGSMLCLTYLNSLTYLNLSGNPKLTHYGIQFLNEIETLKCLILTGCIRVGEQAIQTISQFHEISSLDLRMCRCVTGVAFEAFALSKITDINFWGCTDLQDLSLKFIATLKFLATLNLQNCNQVTDLGLAYLKASPSLKNLTLGNSDAIFDEGIQQLKSCISLKFLSLISLQNITLMGVKSVLSNECLNHLSVVQCANISAEDMSSLSNKSVKIEIDQVLW